MSDDYVMVFDTENEAEEFTDYFARQLGVAKSSRFVVRTMGSVFRQMTKEKYKKWCVGKTYYLRTDNGVKPYRSGCPMI